MDIPSVSNEPSRVFLHPTEEQLRQYLRRPHGNTLLHDIFTLSPSLSYSKQKNTREIKCFTIKLKCAVAGCVKYPGEVAGGK